MADLRALAARHSALAVSLVITMALGAKLLWAVGFNTTSALAVLQVSGTSAVIVGVTVSALPVLSAALGSGVAIALISPIGGRAWRRRRTYWFVGAGVALLFAFFAPITLLSVFALQATVLAALQQKRMGRSSRDDEAEDERRDRVSRQARVLSYLGVGSLGLALLITPWLTPQSVTIDGRPPVQAYVLGDQGGETALYMLKQERVVFVRTGSQTHQVCTQEFSWLFTSTAQLLMSDNYPQCPDGGLMGSMHRRSAGDDASHTRGLVVRGARHMCHNCSSSGQPRVGHGSKVAWIVSGRGDYGA
jgi:hypothetical protein